MSKASPKKGGSPKGSPGKGKAAAAEKKASPKGGAPKKAPEELAAIEAKLFARKRYDEMEATFTQRKENIILCARSIHVYEVWNRLPEYQQFCNSNKDSKGSPKKAGKGSPGKKASPKGSPKNATPGSGGANAVEYPDYTDKPDHHSAVIEGAVCVKTPLIKDDHRVYVEVRADFRYTGKSKVPPYPEEIAAACECYRDMFYIYPYNYNRRAPGVGFSQTITRKLHERYGRGYVAFPFQFCLDRAPDSLYFNRAYFPKDDSGVFWTLRAYIAKYEYCDPEPENEVRMEFYKYTICPLLCITNLRVTAPVKYIRFCPPNEQGQLVLTAQLERDTYYHGEDIVIGINIENDTSRHWVSTVAVSIEQTYRITRQIPQDVSLPLALSILEGSESSLPIQPKNKAWTKEVTLRPAFDAKINNLVTDGRMLRDEKVFLASSTILTAMKRELIPESGDSAMPGEKKVSPSRAKSSSPGRGGKDASPKKKSPRKKSPSPKQKAGAGKKKSPGKGTASPDKAATPPPQATGGPDQLATGGNEVAPPKYKETILLTNRQTCSPVFISYDVVVRLNLRTADSEEAGHPQVRVPFILTRQTQYIDKLNKPAPPTWTVKEIH